MLIFGSDNLYGISAAANSTPRKLGSLQDVSFDFSFDVKQLYGHGNYAIDMRCGKGKIEGKAKSANLNGAAINDLFFNQAASTGLMQSAVNEAGTVPAASPYTVMVANSATWTMDIGVFTANVGGKITTLKLLSCTSSKLSIATKLDDYAVPEFDFEALANAAGSIGIMPAAN